MFNIASLSLLFESKVINRYDFHTLNYYYAQNSSGKTLLMHVLDYMLGGGIDVFSMEGMENVDEIELIANTPGGETFFIRKPKGWFVKYSEEAEKQNVSPDAYKRIINEALIGLETTKLKEYKNLYGEDLTFRAFTFLNFVDEVGIGDIANVFTRQHQTRHAVRIQHVLDFIFDYSTTKRKSDLEKEIKRRQNRLNELVTEVAKYQTAKDGLSRLLAKYGFEYNDDSSFLEESISRIESFVDDETKKFETQKLFELIETVNDITNEIKTQRYLKEKSQDIETRSGRAQALLEEFERCFSDTRFFTNYKSEIERMLHQEIMTQSVLRIKDYEKTIEGLQSEKRKIEKQIDAIRSKSSLPSLQERLLDASLARISLRVLNQGLGSMIEINDLRESISSLDATLRSISIVANPCRSVNEFINEIYLANAESPMVREDSGKTGFAIRFDYKKLCVSGQCKIHDKDKYYLPGSLAKMTLWQICTYLAVLKYVLNENGLPVLPILFIDGINQPFDNQVTGYPELLKLVFAISKSVGVQVIVTSTVYDDALGEILRNQDVYSFDLNGGFNSNHQ